MLKAERGGAVAVWASSGMTMPDGQAVMNQAFYGALFGNRAMRLGEVTMAAKKSVGDQDVRRTWILLGDPSMEVASSAAGKSSKQ